MPSNRRMILKLVAYYLACAALVAAFSMLAYRLRSSMDENRVSASELLPVASGALSLDEARALPLALSPGFEIKGGVGNGTSARWMRFAVDASASSEPLFVNVLTPFFSGEFFVEESPGGRVVPLAIRRDRALSERAIPSYSPAFQLKHPLSQIVYARFTSPFQNFALYAAPQTVFLDRVGWRKFFTSLYLGLVLGLVLYNLSVFVFTRLPAYGYYVGYAAFTGLSFAGLNGVAFEHIYPESPQLGIYSVKLISCFSLGFLVLFFRCFVGDDRYSRVYRAVATLCFVVASFDFTLGPAAGSAGINILSSAVPLGLIVRALILAPRNQDARFFFVAFVPFMFCYVVVMLRLMGIIPHSDYLQYAAEVGNGLELILLAVAVAARIKRLTRDNHLAVAAAAAAKNAAANARLAGVGQAAQHIGDKLNTPLNIILLLAEELPDEDDRTTALKAIETMRAVQDNLREFKKYAPEDSVKYGLGERPEEKLAG